MNRVLKHISFFCILMIIMIVCFPFSMTKKTYAGLVDTNIWDQSMYDSGFKTGLVYTSGNVQNVNGEIAFNDETNYNARIISKTKIYDIVNKNKKCGFNAGLTLKISNVCLDADNKFGFVFGLQSYASSIATKNSSFVYFAKQNDELLIGIDTYDSKAQKTELLVATSIEDKLFDELDTFRLNVSVDSNGGINIKINDYVVVDLVDAGVPFEGFMGLAQIKSNMESSNNIWYVADFVVNGSTNYIPKTKDISASFTDNSYNTNELYTYCYINYVDDCYVKVVDDKLEFKNISSGYLSTKYQFSNYELTFDICDLQREAIFDENQNIIKPISNKISISLYSNEFNSLNNLGLILEICPENWSNSLSPEYTSINLKKDGNIVSSFMLPDHYNIWDKGNAEDVNVRITLEDGLVTLYLKYVNENGYTKVFSYNNFNASQGYIKIFASGTNKTMDIKTDYSTSLACNFKIDNFAVSNSDYSTAKDEEVSYIDNRVYRSTDYNYVDSWQRSDLLFGGNA